MGSSSYNTLYNWDYLNFAQWNGIGFRLDSSNNNNLTSNNVSGNDEFGIIMNFSSNNVLQGNIANFNGFGGIFIDVYSDNNLLSDNIANMNSFYGLYLKDSNNNTLTNNTASTSPYGIGLDNANNNILISNRTLGNDFWDFYMLSG